MILVDVMILFKDPVFFPDPVFFSGSGYGCRKALDPLDPDPQHCFVP